MSRINNINRRKFLEIFGGCSCGIALASCSTAPITERKQLKLIPETTLNRQASQIYERVKNKTKLSVLENKNLDPTKTSILYYSLDDRIHELEKLFNNQNKSNNGFYFLHNTNSGINLKRLKNINSQLSYIEKVAQVMGLSK